MNRRVVVAEDVVARTEVRGEEVDVTWTGSVRAGEHAFEIRIAGERQCQRLSEQQILRRTTIERSPDGVMLGTSIVAGLVLTALGGVFLYDHRDGADTEEPLLYRGDLDVGRGTGIAMLATGAVSLSIAAIAGMRSRDEHQTDPKARARQVPIDGTIACGAARASGIQITLGHDHLAVPGGTTNDGGQLAIPYAALPEPFVVATDVTQLRVSASTGKRTFVVGDVPITLARQVRLAAAWRDADSGGDPERFEHYAQIEPARAGEALARARALRVERVTAKLVARDATAAAADLDILRQRHASGPDVDALARQLEALQSELQAQQRAQQRETVLRALAATIAVVQGGGASTEAFLAARAQLEQAQSAYAGEPAVSELAAVFETARAARVKALLADSQRHLRALAFEPARRAARDAELLAPRDSRAQRAVKSVDDREIAVIAREARKALAAGRMDDAMAAIERGLEIRERDPSMVRVMTQLREATLAAQRREAKAQERMRAAAVRGEVAAARSAARGGDYEGARRIVAEGRSLHGDEPMWAKVLAEIDKTELHAAIRRVEKALAAGRLEDAGESIERAVELGRDDPRVRRLMSRIRKSHRSR